MTYGEFLAACRKLAGENHQTGFNKSEFARLLKLKKPDHYIGTENDKRHPGLELLEKAARAAGLEFKDCIQIPVPLPFTKEEERAINRFKLAVFDDHLKDSALNFAESLTPLKRRLRRQGKPGGDTGGGTPSRKRGRK